jgi:uncharacterized lipoprotein YmbA
MKFAALIMIVFLVGCTSAPVATDYYLLRQDDAFTSRALVASSDYALGNVVIASYIDQPGMVLEVSAGQVRPALHHQWAEPMRQSVRSFLQREISTSLGEDLFPAAMSEAKSVVEIRVDQLHGTDDGEAILLAYWWLRVDGKIHSPYQFSQTLALQRDGYAALAQAEKDLLEAFAASIADTLKASAKR